MTRSTKSIFEDYGFEFLFDLLSNDEPLDMDECANMIDALRAEEWGLSG